MNPELLRNLWLEFSIRRLIAMPLVLALVFIAPLMEKPAPAPQNLIDIIPPIGDEADEFAPQVQDNAALPGQNGFPVRHVAFSAAMIFLLFLWGTRLSAETLFAEVNGRTWDAQRSSAIGPWAMTIGKLFGSTAYVWYGALFCLLFWAVRPVSDASTVLTLIFGGLFAQALALYASLLLLRMTPERSRFRISLVQIGVLAFFAFIVIVFAQRQTQVAWYVLNIRASWFGVASLALAFVWTVIGANQLMRAELQIETGPAAWIGFLVTVAVYVAGFAGDPEIILSARSTAPAMASIIRGLLLAGVVLAILAPISALLAPPRLLTLRRWIAARPFARQGRILTPSWIWPLSLAILLTAAAGILGAFDPGAGMAVFGGMLDGPILTMSVALIAFAIRDIGIIHALTLNPNARRGVTAAMVVMAVSYVVLPQVAGALRASDLAPLFVPGALAPPAFAVGAPIAEAVIAWLFAARAFQRFFRMPAATLLAASLIATMIFASPASAAFGVDEPCPRNSGHEMLLEAGVIFEGALISKGPPAGCGSMPAMCNQEIATFRVDRVLKGDIAPGDTVEAQRVSTAGPVAAGRQLFARAPTALPPLPIPQSGLFALAGGQTIAAGLMADWRSHLIDECLLTLPPDLAKLAEAYAARTAAMKAAVDEAPNDADRTVALADHLLRYRDTASAGRLLRTAIVRFPTRAAIHAQLLYLLGPVAPDRNHAMWRTIRRQLPDAIVHALETPTVPEPESAWIRRRAVMAGGRAPDAGTGHFDDFSSFAFSVRLGGQSLRGAKFVDSEITLSYLRAADLSGADLRWSEFDNDDLSFANLTDADLSDWNPATRGNGLLRHRLDEHPIPQPGVFLIMSISWMGGGLKLLGATLDRAHLDRATLINADLRQASFKSASLKEADLRGSDLRGADFTGADLTGVQLAGARSDCRTQWPQGFAPKLKPDPIATTAFCSGSRIADGR
jgi:hypothetical protein